MIVKYFCEQMHCASCEIHIENSLSKNKNVISVNANAKNKIVEIETTQHINIEQLNTLLANSNYKLTTSEKIETSESYFSSFFLALTIIILFFIMQKAGIFDFVSFSNINYGTIFIIGVVASLSTCMAVIGSLVLSISSLFSNNKKSIIFFHVSRLLSFFIFGGIIGTIGKFFVINFYINILLSVFLFIVTLSLGLSMVLKRSNIIKFTFPKFITQKIINKDHNNKYISPTILGVATFFLPCGFTQAMQMYTINTKDFLSGGLTMLIFALGTFPVLLLLSFASTKVNQSVNSNEISKTIGFVVIMFSFLNLYNLLAALGLVSTIF